MKKLLNNIIFQYSIITFVVILFVAIGLGTILSRQITDHLITSHISIFPNVVRTLIKDHPETYGFLESPPGTEIPEGFKSFINDLLSIGTVFRVKVWNKDATVLWSDKADLIGRTFKDNDTFLKAIRGNVTYGLSMPAKSEHVEEKTAGRILEIYVPVEKNGKYIGVFELYESDDKLHLQISRNIRFVWLLVSIAGIAIYVLLFLIFYRAYLKQKNINEQLIQTQDVTIFALAYQAELRDQETGYHIERTAHYVEILALDLKKHPKYKSLLTDSYISDLVKAAPLHDIGKVAIPDAILLKPGKLTSEEFDKMKRHSDYGGMVLRKAEEKLAFQSFLKLAISITTYHHEKWNGEGYPNGLKGEDIPLSARIMALADVYDALRTDRPYKNAMPHKIAMEIIMEEKGRHFDPIVVEAFLKKEEEFNRISEALSDKSSTKTMNTMQA